MDVQPRLGSPRAQTGAPSAVGTCVVSRGWFADYARPRDQSRPGVQRVAALPSKCAYPPAHVLFAPVDARRAGAAIAAWPYCWRMSVGVAEASSHWGPRACDRCLHSEQPGRIIVTSRSEFRFDGLRDPEYAGPTTI